MITMGERFTMNEPTTGEIVRALRCSADDDSFCKKCQYGYALGSAFLCDKGRMNGNAADRLESQERELSGIAGELERFRAFHERYAEQTSKKYIDDICALTARAESAERERDAVVELYVPQRCSTCAHSTGTACAAQGNGCKWKYRGLQPQEGEWK